eukprot:TRINITY_DN1231_c0_g2_i4.p1 TRINITY_DN1231_c0_g2~~TRINITY_DN1231_c0_g2_i4.p1  ORF type:complete len:238 (-),score=35.70 TRINITY_DN1231_c0_g2_i4:75-788(-)
MTLNCTHGNSVITSEYAICRMGGYSSAACYNSYTQDNCEVPGFCDSVHQNADGLAFVSVQFNGGWTPNCSIKNPYQQMFFVSGYCTPFPVPTTVYPDTSPFCVCRPPSVPALQSPADGLSIVISSLPYIITLKWSSVIWEYICPGDGTGFWLNVTRFNGTTLQYSCSTPEKTFPLTETGTYYWSVRAIKGLSVSTSDTYTFLVCLSGTPRLPQLVTPSPGAISPSGQFTWGFQDMCM